MEYRFTKVATLAAVVFLAPLSGCGGGDNDAEVPADPVKADTKSQIELGADATENETSDAATAMDAERPDSSSNSDFGRTDADLKELDRERLQAHLVSLSPEEALDFGQAVLDSGGKPRVLERALGWIYSDTEKLFRSYYDSDASIADFEKVIQQAEFVYFLSEQLLHDGPGPCESNDMRARGAEGLCNNAIDLQIAAAHQIEEIQKTRAEEEFSQGEKLLFDQGVDAARPKFDAALDIAERVESLQEQLVQATGQRNSGSHAAQGGRNGSFWQSSEDKQRTGPDNGPDSYLARMENKINALVSMTADPEAFNAIRRWKEAESSPRNISDANAANSFYRRALVNGGYIEKLPDLLKACVVAPKHEAFDDLDDEFARHSLLEQLPGLVAREAKEARNDNAEWYIPLSVKLSEYDFDKQEFPVDSLLQSEVENPRRIGRCMGQVNRSRRFSRREFRRNLGAELGYRVRIGNLEESKLGLSLPPEKAQNVDKSSVKLLVVTGAPTQFPEGTKVEPREIIRSYMKKGSDDRVYEIITPGRPPASNAAARADSDNEEPSSQSESGDVHHDLSLENRWNDLSESKFRIDRVSDRGSEEAERLSRAIFLTGLRTFVNVNLSKDEHILALGCVHDKNLADKARTDEFAYDSIVRQLRKDLDNTTSPFIKQSTWFAVKTGIRFGRYDFERKAFPITEWEDNNPIVSRPIRREHEYIVPRCRNNIVSARSSLSFKDVEKIPNGQQVAEADIGMPDMDRMFNDLIWGNVKAFIKVPKEITRDGLAILPEQAEKVNPENRNLALGFQLQNLRWGWNTVSSARPIPALLADVESVIVKVQNRDGKYTFYQLYGAR